MSSISEWMKSVIFVHIVQNENIRPDQKLKSLQINNKIKTMLSLVSNSVSQFLSINAWYFSRLHKFV